MRTTLNIDDDLLRAARAIAEERGITIGEAVSDLLREALRPPRVEYEESGFPVFHVSEDAPPLTPDDVERALADE